MPTGKQLREARKKMNLSVERVAARVGVSVNTIYAWEAGTSSPRDEKTAKKLHELLGLSRSKPASDKNMTFGPVGVLKTAAIEELAKKNKTKVEKVDVEEVGQLTVAEFFHLVAFFMNDQPRRSNTRELLLQAKLHGLDIDDLLGMLDGRKAPSRG